jgi:hypothetical protein
MEVVANYAAAYNRRDVRALTTHFPPAGLIVSDGTFNPFSKTEFRQDEFGQQFADAMEHFPLMNLGEVHVFIVLEGGDKAVLELVSSFGDKQALSKFSLQREGGRWSIVKIRYY